MKKAAAAKQPKLPGVALGVYRVRGYYTGDFIGKVEAVDRDIATVTVIDAPRRMPKIVDRCCYPGCVLKDTHDGQHAFRDFSVLFIGQQLEIPWKLAQFERQAIDEEWRAAG